MTAAEQCQEPEGALRMMFVCERNNERDLLKPSIIEFGVNANIFLTFLLAARKLK